MSLPNSRNTTYGASSPVLSNDLNALEDCIIGVKHPSVEDPIGAQSFVLAPGGTATLGDGRWTFGAVSVLVANLKIIVGTRIHQIEWAYDRGGAGNVTLKLRRRNMIASAGAQPAAANVGTAGVVTVSAGTGWANNLQTYDYVVAAGDAMWLEIQCDNVANIFGGARLFRDRL